MVKSEIVKLLKSFTQSMLVNNINIEKLILFGSHAMEKAGEWSDIDVAVISTDFGKDRFRERILLTTISYKIDPRIEPYPVGLEEFEKESWKTMIHEIKQNGIEIAA
ncbi:MAG: nucleotidyltransferase domain-containing protein [bacterium]|nr:nucleotidyltransferase domain-containing protein [bacterium]